jgi:hypothetical protein
MFDAMSIPADGTDAAWRTPPNALRSDGPVPVNEQQTVATSLSLGARRIDIGQRLDVGHVVLADPQGK